MKRYILLLFTLGAFILPFNSTAQFLTEDEPKRPRGKLSDKIVFGGNFGLALGAVDYVEISPKVGYRFKPKFTAGVGIKYIYYNEDIDYYINGTINTYSYQSKVYGGSIWASYTLISDLHEKIGMNIGDIILYSEIEQLNVDAYKIENYTYYPDGRAWVTSTLVGGGIYQPIGPRAGIQVLVLYNLTDELFLLIKTL